MKDRSRRWQRYDTQHSRTDRPVRRAERRQHSGCCTQHAHATDTIVYRTRHHRLPLLPPPSPLHAALRTADACPTDRRRAAPHARTAAVTSHDATRSRAAAGDPHCDPHSSSETRQRRFECSSSAAERRGDATPNVPLRCPLAPAPCSDVACLRFESMDFVRIPSIA